MRQRVSTWLVILIATTIVLLAVIFALSQSGILNP
jgi:hypothetical protein